MGGVARALQPAMNSKESIIYTETIARENAARESWMEKFGKEYGLNKKKKDKTQKVRRAPTEKAARKVVEEEEEEETRPLSLVYNQERYPAHYDLSRWNDLAIYNGYKAFNFRT